jgi:hypothetical protein
VSFSSPVEIEISRNSMTVTDRGIWAASTSAVVSVSGNIITTTTNYCVDVACPNAIISLNRLTCAATSAINLASTATDATVNGNQVKCTGTSSGIAMSGARCSASGNDISTVAAPCVNILGADCSMNGGVLRPTGGEGIILGQSGSATSGLRATVSAVRITSGTQGIRVYADGCAIVGNNISGAQYWGVNVMSDAAATLVSSNVLAGNTSGGLQDAGTNTVNANNVLTV